MTTADLKTLLEQQIADRNDDRGKGGAAKVACLLGIKESALSRYRKGLYPAPDAIDRRVRELFGGVSVECPEIGTISLSDCSDHKRRQPTTDSFYARMYRACKNCHHNQ